MAPWDSGEAPAMPPDLATPPLVPPSVPPRTRTREPSGVQRMQGVPVAAACPCTRPPTGGWEQWVQPVKCCCVCPPLQLIESSRRLPPFSTPATRNYYHLYISIGPKYPFFDNAPQTFIKIWTPNPFLHLKCCKIIYYFINKVNLFFLQKADKVHKLRSFYVNQTKNSNGVEHKVQKNFLWRKRPFMTSWVKV